MRIINIILCSVFLLSSFVIAGNNMKFYHDTPQGVIRGDKVDVEVIMTDASSDIYDLYLFYKEVGDLDYKSLPMVREGLLYHATVKTAQFTSGQMQYYIGYEGALGEVGTLPEEMPQLNPLVMQIAPERNFQQDSPVEVVILSPLPEESLSEEDIVVAIAIFAEDQEIDYSNTRIIIDGVNIRSNIDFSDGVVTFTPPPGQEFRAGYHNIEVQVYSPEGVVLGQKEWSFRSTQSLRRKVKSFIRGSAFIENRYQNILRVEDNFFRIGGEFSGKYADLDYRGRVVVSSEEEAIRQPVNRFTGHVRYNFSDDNNIFLWGGDFNPYFNPLVLRDKRVRGVHAGLAFGFFTFDYIYGQLNRGVEGLVDSLTSSGGLTDVIAFGGTYAQNMWAIRPGFRFGDNVWWTLNLVNAKQDKSSIDIGNNVNESVSIGTDLNMNFDRKRIIVDMSVNSSIKNVNAGLPVLTWDQFVEFDSTLADNSGAKQAWDFLESTGFLTMTQGVSPMPSLAMQFDVILRYFDNNLKFRYYKIQKDFASPGNPYLLKDISGIHISDNIRLFENQVYMTLFYKNFTTNESIDKEATGNNELGITLSYFPYSALPSLTVNYSRLGRKNDVTPEDDLYMIDNATQRLSFNTSYAVDLSGTRNTFTLNYSTYGRDETANPLAQNDFNLYGIGVRTGFTIPLIVKVNYSKSENTTGSEELQNQSGTDVSTMMVGLDYLLSGVMGGDKFKPFVNYRWQQVDRTAFESDPSTPDPDDRISVKGSTKRNNYTIGLAYQSPKMGILSLRYDHITYDNELLDYDDSVLNFRYTYNF